MGLSLPAEDAKARRACAVLPDCIPQGAGAGDIAPAAMATDSGIPRTITHPHTTRNVGRKKRYRPWISVNLQWRVLGGRIVLGCLFNSAKALL